MIDQCCITSSIEGPNFTAYRDFTMTHCELSVDSKVEEERLFMLTSTMATNMRMDEIGMACFPLLPFHADTGGGEESQCFSY